MSLIDRFINGDVRALSRLISHVENQNPKGLEAVNNLFSRTGRARIIGFTGPPGAGKSTVVDKVARHLRKQGTHHRNHCSGSYQSLHWRGNSW